MPAYDYDCAACGRRFEVIHGVHADPPTTCPLCGSGPIRKAFAAPAVHFKGSGWAKKERRPVAKSSSGASKEAGDGPASTGEPESGSKDQTSPSSPPSSKASSSTPTSSTSGD
jgi:putative FmdB family regulatory protein